MSERRVLATAWSGMGPWRWGGLLLVAIALALTPLGGPSRPDWRAAVALAASDDLPVTLESRCRAATGRCEWRLWVDGETGYRWREAGSDNWRVVDGATGGSYAARPTLRQNGHAGRIEACTAEPPERCARWDLPLRQE